MLLRTAFKLPCHSLWLFTLHSPIIMVSKTPELCLALCGCNFMAVQSTSVSKNIQAGPASHISVTIRDILLLLHLLLKSLNQALTLLSQMLDKQSITQCQLKAAEVGWAPRGVFLARRAYKSKKTKQTMTDITGMQAAALALTLQFFLVWFNPVWEGARSGLLF